MTEPSPSPTAAPSASARASLPTIIGIDLGTTNSVGAWVDPDATGDAHGQPSILVPAGESPLTPSVVSFGTDEEIVVGDAALARALSNPAETVFSVKRLMGKSLAELEDKLALLPYRVVDKGGRIAAIEVGDRAVTPQELSAIILGQVRARAEAALGRRIDKAVVTVPAYFDDAQRQATRDAGRIAGIEVVRIVNEPTAAALAYGLDKKRKGHVAVYDLGGGTFDISILKLHGGVFKVMATAGDTFLGGDDFDRTLVEAALADLKERTGRDLSTDPRVLQALRREAERTKIALSDADQATFAVTLDAATATGDNGSAAREPLTYERTVTRTELESAVAPFVDRTIARCRDALRDAGLDAAAIDEVVMVGGSTRVPLVRERVGELFGRTPHTEVNPDEVVALGAAVQAHILAGGRRDLTLLDVVPLSLGIEVYGGAVQKLVMRNTTIPCRGKDMFTTFADRQTAFQLHVLQGERELVNDCRSLGRFELRGIPPMSAGFPRLAVEFEIDANGTLTVTARELRSQKELEVVIEPSHGLTKHEVDQMVRDSIDHALDDMEARRVIELVNKTEMQVRITRKEVPRAREGGYYPADLLDAIDAKCDYVEAALAAHDPDEIERGYDQLADLTIPLAEKLLEHTARAEFADLRLDDERFAKLIADDLPLDNRIAHRVHVEDDATPSPPSSD